ncbi:MAG: tRNA (N6-isopentenyl adenosine(37)-C2)-methylthiotransferase MiaB [Victivallaceae bacterium]|nr:tRNA (N6-isopentenyl adenosine(37)-C2)-methylthiotransferase MiaB [Victivallaceae bacterium]
MAKRAYIKTYGCQMNERDSEALAAMLSARGWEITSDEELARLLVFNTCSVREQAERKALGKIMHMKKLKRRDENIIIGVIGCMAQRLGDELFKELPHIDFVLGTGELHQLPELVEELERERTHRALLSQSEEVLSGMGAHDFSGGSAIFGQVAITRGCNRFCSYCIVPYVRGREISRDPDDIVSEVETLAAHGVREVMLLGQNVAAFGLNGVLTPPPDNVSPFAELLERVAQVPGIARIRFTSPYPSYFSGRLIDTIAAEPKICRSIHLPLQSGSDRILKAMNRQYTAESYLAIVNRLKTAIPGIAFSTDIIVGFPGETDADFAATRALMNEVGFDNAFIFKYSPREGTASARQMADDVPQETKETRNQLLLADLAARSLAHNRTLIGKEVEILAEGPSFRNPARWSGKTSTAKTVMFAPIPQIRPGDLLKVKIARATHMSLFAGNIPDLPENE